ncbi:hypothetical protein HK105_205873 [Polyrhizophydium stewartii]|uniref:Apple domain-containing protein n=1 Tax=Polyrhizophydium stewartii TaxID=2732419 RepID=A0ABR4N4Z0_9FUNG
MTLTAGGGTFDSASAARGPAGLGSDFGPIDAARSFGAIAPKPPLHVVASAWLAGLWSKIRGPAHAAKAGDLEIEQPDADGVYRSFGRPRAGDPSGKKKHGRLTRQQTVVIAVALILTLSLFYAYYAPSQSRAGETPPAKTKWSLGLGSWGISPPARIADDSAASPARAPPAGKVVARVVEPSTDHNNANINNMAVGILTNSKAAAASVPIQLVTFLKPIKNLLIASDEEGAHIGSIGVDDTNHRTGGPATDGFLTSAERKFRREQPLRTVLDLAATFPDAEWFVLARDDSFLFFENIYAFIQSSGLDSAIPFFIGASAGPAVCAGYKAPLASNDPVAVANIGSGMLLSRAAVKLLTESQVDKCLTEMASCEQGDTMLAMCLADRGVRVSPDPRFHSEPLGWLAWPADSCQEPFGIPGLSQRMIQRLYDSREVTSHVGETAQKYKHDHRTSYGHLFAHIHREVGFHSHEVGIDRPGQSMAQIKSENGFQCQALCRKEDKCVTWVFEAKSQTCWLKDRVLPKSPKDGLVSGTVLSRYSCGSLRGGAAKASPSNMVSFQSQAPQRVSKKRGAKGTRA